MQRLPAAATRKWSYHCRYAWLLCGVLACAPSPVVRVSGGRSFAERRIVARAYAAYLRGRLFESQGETEKAVAEYRRVLSDDPMAAEAMVRLGSLHCSNAPREAEALWEHAEQIDPESPALWLERSRCELAYGRAEMAFEHATHAARFDATADEAIAVIVTASTNLGRTDAGLRWLHAALAARPTDAWLWQLLFEHEAASNSDRLYAARRLLELHPANRSAVPERLRKAQSNARTGQHFAVAFALNDAFEDALQRGDGDRARSLATALGINREQLAQLALGQGAFGIAFEEASLLLSVNPDNAIAWVTGLLAADYLRDPTRFASMSAKPPGSPLPNQSDYIDSLLDLSRRRAASTLGHPKDDTPPQRPRVE